MQNLAAESLLWQRVSGYALADLGGRDVFSAKLCRAHGWTRSYCARVLTDYLRFCYLSVQSKTPLSPSPAVDAVWHLHLTYTRDYWQHFCPHVLGATLHHEPASPGVAQRAALASQYAHTLQTLQRVFGIAPASDIWPGFVEQDLQARQQRQVDRRHYWLIPKPRTFLRRGWMALSVLLLPGTAQALDLNVLDWSGPDFLALFLGLMAAAAIVRLLLERRFRDIGPLAGRTELAHAELALLAGGHERLLDLTVQALVERQSMVVDGDYLKTVRGATGHSALESALLSVCATTHRRPRELAALVAPQLRQMEAQLIRRRLWLDNAQMWSLRLVQLWPIGALWLLGAAKIWIGVQSGRPVLWLVLLMLIVSVRLLRILLEGNRRTRAGSEELHARQQRHATLARASTPADHGLATALFGLGALTAAGAISAYAQLRAPIASSGTTAGSDSGTSAGGCSAGSAESSGESSGSDGGSSGCGGCGGGGGD